MQALDLSRIQPLTEEDLARADWYGLIARLFSAPLDKASLQRLASNARPVATHAGPATAAVAENSLEQYFSALCETAACRTEGLLKEEYDTVFIGTGKAEIFLNASFYQAGFLHERPLVELRSLLNRLGYARKESVSDTEDHLSVICGSMRRLILDRVSIDEQKALFAGFLADWFEPLADAIESNTHTDFYKHVARLMHAFLSIERQSFDFEE